MRRWRLTSAAVVDSASDQRSGVFTCYRSTEHNRAAGVEVAKSVLAETQSAILPLVPYLDTLRWVFIAVALGGIAVTIYARHDDWKRGRR